MYHWITDKQFLKDMKRECWDIINRLKNNINRDSYFRIETQIVGSGANNLITQNEKEPIDLDFNLCIVSIKKNIKESEIKEYVRKHFNKVLNEREWGNCSDSTSALTTKRQHFKNGNQTEFSIDLAIIKKENNFLHKLKHEKTGNTNHDKWYWNIVPDSNDIKNKAYHIKTCGCWNEVREKYLKKKNKFLKEQDYNHPSFICYIEAVNEVYYDLQN